MNAIKQRFLFLLQSFLKPRQMGAISPSSSRLSHAMVNAISPNHSGFVLELGGGTGSLTRQLLLQVDPKKLIVMENNRVMANQLRKKFPICNIIELDAQGLSAFAKSKEISSLNSIFSGLPLRSLPQKVRDTILHSAFALLSPQGRFIQFTYGFKSPVPQKLLDQHHLRVFKKIFVLQNLPPATVWVYEKS
jgi:phosphatidylethanolamine/phosphatidyl-N-methylethanolamine N-methyltransferase